MKLSSASFADGTAIPAQFAFCAQDAATHATLSQNRNPQLAWSGAPAGTKSFVVICHDPDVPSRGDDVNREGRSVSKSLPRIDFFHWVLVDLPAAIASVAAGEFSSAVVPRGKPGPAAPHGARQFTVFALGVPRLSLPERFGGHEVRTALQGHVLAQAAITGRYTLNPAVKI